jgi:hypothetical protein
MKKTILIIILAAVVIGGFITYRIYNKPHRDVTQEKAVAISADDIYKEYVANEATANSKYLNKAVEVSGEISDIQVNQDSAKVVYLKTSDPFYGVNCTFKQDPGELQKGQQIKFKGICTGYITGGDVVLNEGVIIK